MIKHWIAAMAAASILVVGASGPKAQGHAHGAKHGGLYVEAEGHHGVELVLAPAAIKFYLSDDDKPMDLVGAEFRAVVQADGKNTVVPLKVDGDGLTGSLTAALPSGAIVVISGKDRHGHAVQARFVVR